MTREPPAGAPAHAHEVKGGSSVPQIGNANSIAAGKVSRYFVAKWWWGGATGALAGGGWGTLALKPCATKLLKPRVTFVRCHQYLLPQAYISEPVACTRSCSRAPVPSAAPVRTAAAAARLFVVLCCPPWKSNVQSAWRLIWMEEFCNATMDTSSARSATAATLQPATAAAVQHAAQHVELSCFQQRSDACTARRADNCSQKGAASSSHC